MKHQDICKKLKFASLVLRNSLFIFVPLETAAHIYLHFYPLHHEYEYFNVVFFPSILFLGSLFGLFSAVYFVEGAMKPPTEDQKKKQDDLLYSIYKVEYDNIVKQYIMQPIYYVVYFIKSLFGLL